MSQRSKFVKQAKPVSKGHSKDLGSPLLSTDALDYAGEKARKQEEAHNSILRKMKKSTDKKVVRILSDVYNKEHVSASKKSSQRTKLVMLNVDVEKSAKQRDRSKGQHSSSMSIAMNDSVTNSSFAAQVTKDLRVKDLEHVYRPPQSNQASRLQVARASVSQSDTQGSDLLSVSPPRGRRTQMGTKRQSHASSSSLKPVSSSEEEVRAYKNKLPAIRHVKKVKKGSNKKSKMRNVSMEIQEEHPYLEETGNLLANYNSRLNPQSASRRSLIEAQNSSGDAPEEKPKFSRNAFSENKTRIKAAKFVKQKATKTPKKDRQKGSFDKWFQSILPYIQQSNKKDINLPALHMEPLSMQLLKNAQSYYQPVQVQVSPMQRNKYPAQTSQPQPLNVPLPRQLHPHATQALQAKAKRLGRLVDVLVKSSPKKYTYLQKQPAGMKTRQYDIISGSGAQMPSSIEQANQNYLEIVQPMAYGSQSTAALVNSPQRPLSQLYDQFGQMQGMTSNPLLHSVTQPLQHQLMGKTDLPASKYMSAAPPSTADIKLRNEKLKQAAWQQQQDLPFPTTSATISRRSPAAGPLNPNWSSAAASDSKQFSTQPQQRVMQSPGVAPFDKSPLKPEDIDRIVQTKKQPLVTGLTVEVESEEFELGSQKLQSSNLQDYLEASVSKNVQPLVPARAGLGEAECKLDSSDKPTAGSEKAPEDPPSSEQALPRLDSEQALESELASTAGHAINAELQASIEAEEDLPDVNSRDDKRETLNISLNLDEKLSLQDEQNRSIDTTPQIQSKQEVAPEEPEPSVKVVAVSVQDDPVENATHRTVSMANEDNKVESWEEKKNMPAKPQRALPAAQAEEIKVHEVSEALMSLDQPCSDDPVEQDQMHALIDNQTQLMRIMDRDRNRIQQLEARIRELQGQVIKSKQSSTTQRFMQTQDRWRNAINEAGTQTDVVIEVTHTFFDAAKPIELAREERDEKVEPSKSLEGLKQEEGAWKTERDLYKNKRRESGLQTAKSMAIPTFFKQIKTGYDAKQNGTIHEASMSEANRLDLLSVGEDVESDNSSVKLPSDSYGSIFPEIQIQEATDSRQTVVQQESNQSRNQSALNGSNKSRSFRNLQNRSEMDESLFSSITAAENRENEVAKMQQMKREKLATENDFSAEQLQMVRDSHVLHMVAEVANAQIYKIRNHVGMQRVDFTLIETVRDADQDVREEQKDRPGQRIETILLSEFCDRVLSDLQLDWVIQNPEENANLERLLKNIGAIVKQSGSNESLMIRFEKLISALKVHGYSFGDMTIMADTMSKGISCISIESREILKALAERATKALEAYMERLDSESRQNIRKKHVDLFSVVLIAFFDDIIVNKKVGKTSVPVIETSQFFQKLYSLKVRLSPKEVQDLSSFLAYKNESNFIDVKRLATATAEFVRNQYLKSFGTSKKKIAAGAGEAAANGGQTEPPMVNNTANYIVAAPNKP